MLSVFFRRHTSLPNLTPSSAQTLTLAHVGLYIRARTGTVTEIVAPGFSVVRGGPRAALFALGQPTLNNIYESSNCMRVLRKASLLGQPKV